MALPEDVPPPDPAKLLAAFMEWERGTTSPGQVLANLKKAGLRELLEATVVVHEQTPVEPPPTE